MAHLLRIKSSFIHLRDVELFLEDVLRDCELSSQQFAFVSLAICESVNNAIGHGNKFDETKYVTLVSEVAPDCISFEVHDEGTGFDISAIPDPTTLDNIRKEGGRGLYIIRNLADEISFRNNGSVIHIKFKIERGI